MKHIPYQQNPTVIDISKKARPPPGEILPTNMNYLINKYNGVLEFPSALKIEDKILYMNRKGSPKK